MRTWLERIDQLDVGFWKFPDQIVRLAFLFAIAIAALVVARCQFTPATFGEEGHYRSEARRVVAAQGLHYAGSEACMECHEEEAEAKHRSFHRNLACEVCHGASHVHVTARMESEEEDEADAPHVPSKREECLYCHSYLSSRPTGFPQVIELLHNPMKACTACHNPHDPTPPEVPGACSACHAQIARTKAISHHSAVPCEQCHEAPTEHRERPRQHLPKKPTSRDFCGTCHEKGAKPPAELGIEKGIPHVDMSSHGGHYLCWQCHYPHFPEAGR